jgi:1-acyl-sn-glycerol-3-phosphate acyltransferase
MAATLDRFASRFARCGFRRDALKPVYGLAEASLCVTATPPGRLPRIDRLARDAFQRARAIVPASAEDPNPLQFVGCGKPIPRHEVACVDETGAPVGDRIEGRIWFRGPSSMQGYFANPEATAAVVRPAGWIDSGDLGYLADGDLFVTGRAKDVIIAGGRNIYPQEVEEAAGEIAGIRRGCVAAFGLADAQTGTERLVVVAEARDRDAAIGSALRDAVVARVVDLVGVPPDVVALVRPGSIPKTSSGKIRRATTRDLYASGALERGRASTAIQWARLAARGAAWHVAQAGRTATGLAFTAWVWLLAGLAVPLIWLAVAPARSPQRTRRVLRGSTRLLLTLCGLRPSFGGQGAAGLASAHPAILVGNHASYADVVLLLSVLPPAVRFAAKARLATYPVLGTIIRRAGYVEVQRGAKTSADDLTDTLRAGESLFIFPEGTFTRAPGVMPFRLGAFQAAVDAGRPVVPVALRGTRDVWPDETWRFRRAPLTIVVGEPIVPATSGWSETVRARDAARAFVAEHCGEAMVDRGVVFADAPVTEAR